MASPRPEQREGAGEATPAPPVIASEAKQSPDPGVEIASSPCGLLAMTGTVSWRAHALSNAKGPAKQSPLA